MSNLSECAPEKSQILNHKSDVCDLCGLTIPTNTRSLTRKGQNYRFCCMGCRQVFQMLADATESPDIASFKDTEIFKQCQALGIIPTAQAETARDNPDSLENQAKYCQDTENDHFLKTRFSVENMWCPACAWVIEKTLLKQKGVLETTCHFSTDRLEVTYNPVQTSPHRISRYINSLGYTLSAPGEESESKEKTKEFVRFGVSAFLTMNVMMLSFSLYSGFFTDLSPADIRFISWPILLMASVVVFYGGRKIHQKGWAAWRSLGFGMETLISAGALSAYFFSLYNFLGNSIHLYFDTSAMLITLVLLGKLLESRAKKEVNKDLESFFSLVPTKVRIPTPAFPDGRYVSAGQLGEGECFILDKNEISPADGVIIGGRATVDESSLTGEATPKKKQTDDRITSGTRLISGKIKVRAEVVGEKSVIGQMTRIMEQTLGQKTTMERKTDIALKWFVPVVLVLASVTCAAGILFGLSIEQAIVRGVTVMVISCPCALGIAIPLARTAGISLACQKGILVRDFSAFETAPNIDTFVFDKTGTLTTGNWDLIHVEPIDPWSAEKIIAIAAALEQHSKHHIGTIIRQYARHKKIMPVPISQVKFHENGVSGIFNQQKVKMGSASFTMNSKNGYSHKLAGESDKEVGRNIYSTVYLTVNNTAIGKIVFGDRIKKGAADTIGKLQKKHYQTFLISGDSSEVTRTLAQQLGIQTSWGEMLPSHKAGFIGELKKEGKVVAMIGDGINDAPAMARSDLAMAVHSESLPGKEASHLTFMRNNPLQIIDFLSLARNVNGKINQNLIFSFLYNVISIPVAMAGLLSPLVAVCAMLLSSLSVTGNTLLMMQKGNKNTDDKKL